MFFCQPHCSCRSNCFAHGRCLEKRFGCNRCSAGAICNSKTASPGYFELIDDCDADSRNVVILHPFWKCPGAFSINRKRRKQTFFHFANVIRRSFSKCEIYKEAKDYAQSFHEANSVMKRSVNCQYDWAKLMIFLSEAHLRFGFHPQDFPLHSLKPQAFVSV